MVYKDSNYLLRVEEILNSKTTMIELMHSTLKETMIWMKSILVQSELEILNSNWVISTKRIDLKRQKSFILEDHRLIPTEMKGSGIYKLIMKTDSEDFMRREIQRSYNLIVLEKNLLKIEQSLTRIFKTEFPKPNCKHKTGENTYKKLIQIGRMASIEELHRPQTTLIPKSVNCKQVQLITKDWWRQSLRMRLITYSNSDKSKRWFFKIKMLTCNKNSSISLPTKREWRVNFYQSSRTISM